MNDKKTLPTPFPTCEFFILFSLKKNYGQIQYITLKHFIFGALLEAADATQDVVSGCP